MADRRDETEGLRGTKRSAEGGADGVLHAEDGGGERGGKHARRQEVDRGHGDEGHLGLSLASGSSYKMGQQDARTEDVSGAAPRPASHAGLSIPPSSSTHGLPPKPPFSPPIETAPRSPPSSSSAPSFSLPRPNPRTIASNAHHRGMLQQPTQVSSFSYDSERRILHDDSSRTWYRRPPVGADLNYGFERATWRDESRSEHLDAMLYSLMHRSNLIPEATKQGQELHLGRYDVITWRGIVTRLATSLYEERGSGWELNGMLLGKGGSDGAGTLYLEEHVSRERREEKRREMESDRNRLFTYYGYAFESYSTSSHEHPSPSSSSWSSDVNTNVQWCSIVRTKLESSRSGTHRLLFGGEVDCISRPHHSQRKELVELKTSMSVRRGLPRDLENLHRKMLGWHFQSYLLGVGRIVVGFRNRGGFVESVEEFDTLKLPRLAGGMWDPAACLSFANDTIAFIRRSVRSYLASQHPSNGANNDGHGGNSEPPMFRISFAPPFNCITMTLLNRDAVAEVKDGEEDRVGFLPRDYYDFVRAQERGEGASTSASAAASTATVTVTQGSGAQAYEY